MNKIIRDSRFIVAHTKNISFEDFIGNELLIDSTLFRIVQISENANFLTEEFKSKHISLPWIKIKGMKNRIVHDYGNVSLKIAYDTATKDIPKMLKILEKEMF